MNKDFLAAIPAPILLKLKNIKLDVPSRSAHSAIDELLANSVLLGGKRLRPLLTYLFADFFNMKLNSAEVLANSIEMVHAASLAHDDVIDEASTRRGVESINIQASNKKAILAGDYLLAAVIGRLCEQTNNACVGEMASIIEKLAIGEWQQSDAIANRSYSKELLENIAHNKTSSVMSWCAASPAIMTDQSEQCIRLARSFGHHLGLAFQYIDDTLDFSNKSDKDQFLDIKNSQVNSVVYSWFESNPKAHQLYREGENLSSLLEGADFSDACLTIKTLAFEHLDSARSDLKKMSEIGKSGTINLKSVRAIEHVINFLGNRDS